MQPILKWAGGKRQLLPEILPFIRNTMFRTYVEPFVGGGAVLFKIQPEHAIINDCNEELINVYRQVEEAPDELIALLEKHKALNSPLHFYEVRDLDRTKGYELLSAVEKAARTIYLNRTCYNGLFRVNKKGQFNSPYGKYKNPHIVMKDEIREMSRYFNEDDIQICCGDYGVVLENVPDDAFVYLDPPYMPVSDTASFTDYTRDGFSYEKQVELRDACVVLREKGIPFLQSNSDCNAIRELYCNFNIVTVEASRSINSRADARCPVNEVLIY